MKITIPPYILIFAEMSTVYLNKEVLLKRVKP